MLPEKRSCNPALHQWCAGMESRLNDDNEAHGLSQMDVADMEAQTVVTIGVQLRDKRHVYPIALNFCPWCGTDLRPWLHAAPWKEATAEVKP